MTGVDASGSLLRAARKRAAALEVSPRFLRADARALPLAPGRLDAALLLFNSLGYGSDEDSLAMLREARRCAPALLLEVAHRDEQVRRTGPGRQREWMELEGKPVLTERWIDPVAGIAHATFRFGRAGEREKRLRHRLFTATELCALLRAAGYARLEVHGGYDRRPFTVDSPQLLVRAS